MKFPVSLLLNLIICVKRKFDPITTRKRSWCDSSRMTKKGSKELQLAIHNAAQKGSVEEIELLINGKCLHVVEQSLNLPTENIPLIAACEGGFPDVVRFLIHLGSDPSVYPTFALFSDTVPETALNLAIKQLGSDSLFQLYEKEREKYFEVIKVLVEEAKVDLGKNEATRVEPPLLTACAQGNLFIVWYLCEHGASVHDHDSKGSTGLMVFPWDLCPIKSFEVCMYLLHKGISLDATNHDGQTALHIAVLNGSFLITKVLLNHGAKFIQDSYGETPLTTAALYGEQKIFDLLLGHENDLKLKRGAKLLYATRAVLEQYDETSLNILREALESPINLEEPAVEFADLNPAYDSLQEARSYSQFESAEDLERFAIMQCFIIRERILGSRHPEVRSELNKYINQNLMTTYQPRDNAIRCYALSLYQSCLVPRSEFDQVASSFYQWIESSQDLLEEAGHELELAGVIEVAVFLIHEVCKALEEANQELISSHEDLTSIWLIISDAKYVLRLIAHIGCESFPFLFDDENPLGCLGINVPRFVKLVADLGYSVFHNVYYFPDQWSLKMKTVERLCRRSFMNSGVVRNQKSRNYQLRIIWLLFASFLVNGSRLFVPVSLDQRVFDCLQEDNKLAEKDPIPIGQFITLKDICIEVVEANYSSSFLRRFLSRNVLPYIDESYKYF
ncbi:unnamed protein product [Caenorhabditis auriculariae]|uniref:ANK_REP_REGION domain-containing protein n=1 Tax=Caenorhabditis auriculariae TaxID=2777116 RepID=A0A8S1H1N7_9PELO|nr:unnamed protein product [Caenorhabditis auriculariae]